MASTAPITILVHEWVTGGGLAGQDVPRSWAAEGLAMRRAIAAEFACLPGPGARVVVTVDDRWPDTASPWTTIRLDPMRTSQQLAGRAREEANYTILIAPESGGILAGLAAALESAGVCSLGCSARSIELAANKAKLADWFRSRGIATPSCRTIVPALGLPRDAHYPAVLKPVDGAGSVDTFLVADADELPPEARALPVALLQPFHAGIPMSASFLVGDDRAWLIGLGRQRVAVEGGRFVYHGGVLPVACDRALTVLRRAVESLTGLRGFVGLDFLWEPEKGQAVVLEINPRPTTSSVGLCRLLPPGCLAAAWLTACRVPGFDIDVLDTLAGIVHRQPPICFNADGTIGPAHEVDS